MDPRTLVQNCGEDLSDWEMYTTMYWSFQSLGIESLFKNFPDFEQNNTRIAAYGNATHLLPTKEVENW